MTPDVEAAVESLIAALTGSGPLLVRDGQTTIICSEAELKRRAAAHIQAIEARCYLLETELKNLSRLVRDRTPGNRWALFSEAYNSAKNALNHKDPKS